MLHLVPYQYGARSDRLRSVERDAEVRNDAGPRTPCGFPEADEADAGVTSGRLECMSGRQHARTGSGGAISQPWDIQQADKSIRVRNAGERLLPRPGSSNDLARWTEPLPVCRFLLNGVRDARLASGRPRKRPFAKRSAP